jgi:hypothetical protein
MSSDTNIVINTTTDTINLQVSAFTETYSLSVLNVEGPTRWGMIVGSLSAQTDLYAALSTLQRFSYTDFAILSAGLDVTNTFLVANSALWVDSYTWVSNNSTNATFDSVSATTLSGTLYGDGSHLTGITSYENVYANAGFATIQEFAASNPQNVKKGYTVTLINDRVYIFAGTDPTNYSHYLELNANPFTPIYQEIALDQNQTLIDMFYLGDFKTAKYTLQIETNFNNEIYYSELNVVGSVQTQTAAVSEYGQISTSDLILGYSVDINSNYLHLYLNHSSDTNSTHKMLVKGLRTNHYKI